MTEQNDWNFDRGELPHRAQLHRMALRLTRSAESAEDLLQDTYLKEIATLLEIPPGTVMSRLYRGRRLLERALLSLGVRYNYLTRRPRRLRSTGIDLDRIFDLSAAPAAPAGTSAG